MSELIWLAIAGIASVSGLLVWRYRVKSGGNHDFSIPSRKSGAYPELGADIEFSCIMLRDGTTRPLLIKREDSVDSAIQ